MAWRFREANVRVCSSEIVFGGGVDGGGREEVEEVLEEAVCGRYWWVLAVGEEMRVEVAVEKAKPRASRADMTRDLQRVGTRM